MKQSKTQDEHINKQYPTVRYSGIKNKPWMLVEPFTMELSNGDKMYIFQGYWTDFASIPRFLKLFIDHLGIDQSAFLCHDYFYNFGGYTTRKLNNGYITKRVDRKWADKEMKFHMKRLGASKLRQAIFYFAVRVGGLFSFRTV